MTAQATHTFTTTVVQWHSPNGVWHFIGVTPAVAEHLHETALMRRLESGRRSGFGAVSLTVRIGATQWRTSAFPLKDAGWSIPLSAKVRKAEGLVAGASTQVALTF